MTLAVREGGGLGIFSPAAVGKKFPGASAFSRFWAPGRRRPHTLQSGEELTQDSLGAVQGRGRNDRL